MFITETNTKYGRVSGKETDCCAVYKGIPFAKPPVGELRFMPPVEPDPWEGTLECTEFKNGPVITGTGPRRVGPLPTGEDCLYINVWTPAKSVDDKLAVMVWIYGGGFQSGNAADPRYDGTEMTKQDVIVVNFNYRVGVMGFTAHPILDKRSPTGTSGNYGLLDEVLALKWVHENIASFGGDPDRVMIHGQSAGGISCRMMLTSPLSQGLFKRIIVQSGGGLNEADPVRPLKELEGLVEKALDKLGWTGEDLLTRDAQELTIELTKTGASLFPRKVVGLFQPCVDNIVLNDPPGVSIAKGEYSDDIDIICGTVRGDAWMFSREVLDVLGEYEEMHRAFSYSPIESWGEWAVRNGRRNIRTYYFEVTQPEGHFVFGGDGMYRYGQECPHGAEIPYIFENLDKRPEKFSDYDYEVAKIMNKLWSNYAKTGDPNGEGLPEWPVFSKENPVSLHVTDNGFAAEDIIDSDIGRKVVDYTISHPGMLESLDDFDFGTEE